jgi:16S rRNA (guanine966-N2)-methyltransferase
VTRIIAGSVRGRRLRTPAGRSTRPTPDRVREALFSALESELGTLAGMHFLDLFAGSGAVGLEARSRGASSVVLVEHDRTAADVIRANIRDLGLDRVTVRVHKAERLTNGVGTRPDELATPVFDVVYADPPYDMAATVLAHVIAGLLDAGRLSDEALVVVERARREADWVWPAGLRGVRERRYGDTMLFYGRVVGLPVSEQGGGLTS